MSESKSAGVREVERVRDRDGDESGDGTSSDTYACMRLNAWKRVEARQTLKRPASARQYLKLTNDEYPSSSFYHLYSDLKNKDTTPLPLSPSSSEPKRIKTEHKDGHVQSNTSTSTDTSTSIPVPACISTVIAGCVSPCRSSPLYSLECLVKTKSEEKEIKVAPRLKQVSSTCAPSTSSTFMSQQRRMRLYRRMHSSPLLPMSATQALASVASSLASVEEAAAVAARSVYHNKNNQYLD
jgi:hypothetical protein